MSVVAVAGGDGMIALAAEGGDAFATRLKALNEAEAAYKKAYSDLNIGKDAVVEYDKARALRTQAEELLAKARTEAADLVQNAREQAKTIEDSVAALREEARDTAVRLDSDCARARQETDDYAAKVLTEVKAKEREAELALRRAEKVQSDADKAWAEASQAADAAAERVAKADQVLLAARNALKEA